MVARHPVEAATGGAGSLRMSVSGLGLHSANIITV